MSCIETKDLSGYTITKLYEIANEIGVVKSEGYKQRFTVSLTIEATSGDSVTITCQKYDDIKQNLIECIVKANTIRFLCND